MSNINDFPIDNDLKEMITNIVRNKLLNMGIELGDNEAIVFKETCAEELVENVLECIHQWEKQKLN